MKKIKLKIKCLKCGWKGMDIIGNIKDVKAETDSIKIKGVNFDICPKCKSLDLDIK